MVESVPHTTGTVNPKLQPGKFPVQEARPKKQDTAHSKSSCCHSCT